MSTPPTAPRSAEYAINHLKMYTDGSATSFHGCMTRPTKPVMSPPVRKEVVFQKWRWPWLHCPSKGIAVDKQAQDDIMHLGRFRKADGLAGQAFNPRP